MVDVNLDSALKAASSPARRAILDRLADAGPARVTDLAAPLSMSLNGVSKHIKVLEGAGLVRREVRGREHWIAFEPAPLAEAARWLDTYRRFWTLRLDNLDAYLRAISNDTDAKTDKEDET